MNLSRSNLNQPTTELNRVKQFFGINLFQQNCRIYWTITLNQHEVIARIRNGNATTSSLSTTERQFTATIKVSLLLSNTQFVRTAVIANSRTVYWSRNLDPTVLASRSLARTDRINITLWAQNSSAVKLYLLSIDLSKVEGE